MAQLKQYGIKITRREIVNEPIRTLTSKGWVTEGMRRRVKDYFTNSEFSPEVRQIYHQTGGSNKTGEKWGFDPRFPPGTNKHAD